MKSLVQIIVVFGCATALLGCAESVDHAIPPARPGIPPPTDLPGAVGKPKAGVPMKPGVAPKTPGGKTVNPAEGP